jgi:hypothetical protein
MHTHTFRFPFYVAGKTRLSKGDKAAIAKMYPLLRDTDVKKSDKKGSKACTLL